MITNIAAILILSYLAGSFPTSIILGKILKGIDIRDYGSGNAGGTNAFRVLGWKAGISTMVFDVFKGFAATYWIASINFMDSPLPSWTPILAGVAAILGHTYTVFAGFKGGKGVGTAAGMLIALYPIAVLICLAVFLTVLIITGYVSLSSISAAVTLPVVLWLFRFSGFKDVDNTLFIFGIIIPLFILFTHRSNIKRLINGNENRFEKVRIFHKS